jgi:uncharacterized protein (DUF302 family)
MNGFEAPQDTRRRATDPSRPTTTTYTLRTEVARPYDAVVASVREALAEQGFGVLTEIDLAATLKAKLDVDLLPEVILGACRPPLAHQAIEADPAIATVLPCNVVVRATDGGTTVVEALDPAAMMGLSNHPALRAFATDARARIRAALDTLTAPDQEARDTRKAQGIGRRGHVTRHG